MNGRRFSWLLYREAEIAKKHIITACLITLGFMVLAILIVISKHYGNLAKLSLDKGAEQTILIITMYLPVCMLGMITTSIAETSVIDSRRQWKDFSRSAPVTPFQFILAKMVMVCISVVAELGLGIAYGVIYNSVNGTAYDIGSNIKTVVLFVAVSLYMYFVMQIGMLLFGSVDKAGIMSGLAVMIPVYIYVFTRPLEKVSNNVDVMKVVSDLSEAAFPYAVAAIVVLIVAGLFLFTALLKRRDK